MDNLYENRTDKIFFIILAMTFLTPDIRLPGVSFFRMEQLFSVSVVVYLFIRDILVGLKSFKVKVSFIAYMILGGTYFISLFHTQFVGVNVNKRDFLELYKIVVYSSLYVVVSKYDMEPNKAIRYLSNMILILSLLAITQYFNFLNLNQLYVAKIAPTQHITLISNHITPRVIGLSSNPNTFGFITAIGCVLNMYLYLYHKCKYAYKYIAKTLIIFVALMMTFSRTSLIIMVIMVFILFLSKLDINQVRSVFRMMLLGVGGILFFIFLLPEKLKLRLINFNILGDSSFRARYDNWAVAFKFIEASPLFGIGTTKSILDFPTIDNEWLLLLKTYGIVGTTIFIFALLAVFWEIKSRELKVLYFSVIIGTFLFMIPASVYNTFQLMSIVIILGSISCKIPKDV